MIKWIMKQLTKYKELIRYGICGTITTIINIVVFRLLRLIVGMDLVPSNTCAWIAAFIFSFLTNKLWVFESKSWSGNGAWREMAGFLLTRLVSMALDMFLIVLLIEIWGWEELLSKIIVNVVVIIFNYVTSKFWVFKKHNR